MVDRSWPLSGGLPLISVWLGLNPVNSSKGTISVVCPVSTASCTKTKVHLCQEADTIFNCVHKVLGLPIMDIQPVG